MADAPLHHFGSRPLLIDLYCCQGGAGKGYELAGFDVIGVDLGRLGREAAKGTIVA